MTGRFDCFHWTLIPPSSNLNCWSQLHELIPVYQYARAHLKPQNFTWITIFTVKFYKVMPIANIFSSYWSYIHGISGSRRNDFLNLNELRTEHRTENPIIYWFKGGISVGWTLLSFRILYHGSTTNVTMLFYF